jgi:hypothetical protein
MKLYINDIIRYEKSDYLEAIDFYLEKITKNDDVISVYQMGSIKYPGLSDIDFIIVLKDKPKHFTWKEFSIRNLSEKQQYLFLHEPYVIQESLMPFIKFLYSVSNLKLLYGKPFRFKFPEKEICLHLLINDFICGYALWPERAIKKKYLKYRELLPQINSIKFNISLFNSIIKDTDFVKMQNYYLKRNDYLRKNFFDLNKKEVQTLVSDLIIDAIEINNQITDKIHNFVDEKLMSIKNMHVYFGFLPKRVLIFKNKMKREGLFLRFLPTTFSLIVKERYYDGIKDKKYERAFEKRMKYLKEYENFIFANKLNNFMKFSILHL